MEDILSTPLASHLALMATFDPTQIDHGDETVQELLDWHTITINRVDGAAEAMLSETARITALAAALHRYGPDALGKIRNKFKPHFKTTLQDVIDASLKRETRPIEEWSEDELAALLHVERWSTAAFAKADLSSERFRPTREEIEGRLRILNITRPISDLLVNGFVGRNEELNRLHAYRNEFLGRGATSQFQAFVVYGVGGMGKSTLVARFVQDVIDGPESVPHLWAYLDFDRPTLNPRRQQDPESWPPPRPRIQLVIDDLIRQIGAQRPEIRSLLESQRQLFVDQKRAEGLESVVGIDESYEEGAVRLAELSRKVLDGAQLIVVLDTFEEVERYGEGDAKQLRRLFEKMSSVLPSLRLIVSGRSPAAVFRSDSKHELKVDELTDEAAQELLEHLVRQLMEDRSSDEQPTVKIDRETTTRITKLVGRSPLTLQLAARVLASEGMDGITDAARKAETLQRIRTEFVQGFLYHRIVNHVKAADDELREAIKDIARAGLALRLITEPAIEHVLLPALGKDASSELASKLFGSLRTEVALAHPISEAALSVRKELRRPALKALQLDDAPLVRRVHKRAADYFESIHKMPEAIYHKLAGGDSPASLDVEFTSDLLQDLAPSLDDLPKRTAQVLKGLEGGSNIATAELDKERDQLEWERRTLSTADTALRRGDVVGARKALEERDTRSPTTELHRIESRILEQNGDLEGAIRAAKFDLDAARNAEHPRRVAAATVRLAKLLEWQQIPEKALSLLGETEETELLAGEWGLRLELVLDRLATSERAGLDTPETRWDWGLDARHRLSRSPVKTRNSSAIIRLLAATLGRDEKQYLRDAVLRIGLHTEMHSSRLEDLAASLAAWDRDLARPQEAMGSVARVVGLRESNAGSDLTAWRAHLAGLGKEASSVLSKKFWELRPPQQVLNALRATFLFWNYDIPGQFLEKAEPHEEGGAEGQPHFLDELPLNFGREKLRKLESQLRASYSNIQEIERLVSIAGIERSQINFSAPPDRVLRAVLMAVRTANRITPLLQVVLADAASSAVKQRLRRIIGAAWLAKNGLGGGIMTELDITQAATASGLEPQSVGDFLGHVTPLTDNEKKLIINQALVLMDELYVHLPLKRAMYATDPVQHLKLLRHRLPAERAFHEEMISIFMSVRDLHTNYILPQPYTTAAAVLPFRVGEYFDGDTRRYIVFATAGEDPSFRPGVPVTHWNGVPIARAVELNARRHAGGNDAAKHARGLQRMTARPLMMSLPPDEAWVDVRYLDADGNAQERRFEWKVVVQESGAAPENIDSAIADENLSNLTALGLDIENEVANDIIEAVFDQEQVKIEADVQRFLENLPADGGLESAVGPDFANISTMPRVFRFGTVSTPLGELGRIQIRTFYVNDADAFVEEFKRIAALLPQDRLIIDVRGNGGGNIVACEKLLQTITDATIEPERLHFINSPLVLQMVEANASWFGKWLPSLRRAVTTGAVYSQGMPFLDPAEYNKIGRCYPGKVILLTDAFCYSATDIFSAGFKDHSIGPILGTMENTGAGGANVFDWDLMTYLFQGMPDSPIQKPPKGATFRVAIRRTTRIGHNAGVPLEDLGVEPHEVHRTTLNDLIENEADLFAHAAELLEKW